MLVISELFGNFPPLLKIPPPQAQRRLSAPGTLSAAGSGRTNLEIGANGVVAVLMQGSVKVHPTTKVTQGMRNHRVVRQNVVNDAWKFWEVGRQEGSEAPVRHSWPATRQ